MNEWAQHCHPKVADEGGLNIVDVGGAQHSQAVGKVGTLLGEVPEVEQCAKEGRVLHDNAKQGLPLWPMQMGGLLAARVESRWSGGDTNNGTEEE